MSGIDRIFYGRPESAAADEKELLILRIRACGAERATATLLSSLAGSALER